MEEISKRCERLKLTEHEAEQVELDDEEVLEGWVLAGRFLSKRRINLEAVVKALKPIWKTSENFVVQDIGDNATLFIFQNEEDLNRVLKASPWSFDKYLLVFHKLGKGDSASSITFNRSFFWIQVHGLPMRMQTKEVAEKIAGQLGPIEKVDVGSRGFSLGKYLRLRVSIDISKPLCRGRVVRMGATEKDWVDFRYERLPIFCYWCGKLDHDDRDCPLSTEINESLEFDRRQYGSWLRADSEKLQRPQLAEVPSQKKGGEGPYKGWEHHGNNQAQDKNWRTTGVVHRSEVGGVPFSPKTPTPETDSVIEDATRQEKKTRDFETQLREIDCAIFAVDTDKESFEKRESAKENRAGPGFSPIDQSKAQTHGTGGKEIN